jgi:hypothetical protein
MTQKSLIKMQISPIKNQNLKNRLGTYLIGPKWRYWKKFFLDISKKKFGSAYAQSLRKCSNIEILAKIEGKEAKFYSKIYEGHIRIYLGQQKNSKLSHACVPLNNVQIKTFYRCHSKLLTIFFYVVKFQNFWISFLEMLKMV